MGAASGSIQLRYVKIGNSAQFPHINGTLEPRAGGALVCIWDKVSQHLARSSRLKLLNDLGK